MQVALRTSQHDLQRLPGEMQILENRANSLQVDLRKPHDDCREFARAPRIAEMSVEIHAIRYAETARRVAWISAEIHAILGKYPNSMRVVLRKPQSELH